MSTPEKPRIPKAATLSRDADAKAANALHDDVDRMAAVGRILRRVYIHRLYGSAAYMRKWIGKNCDFSPASGLRYMLLDRYRAELQEAGLIKLADAYDFLELNSQLSINLSSPLWVLAGAPIEEAAA